MPNKSAAAAADIGALAVVPIEADWRAALAPDISHDKIPQTVSPPRRLSAGMVNATKARQSARLRYDVVTSCGRLGRPSAGSDE